jgi:hypothetical protein
MQRLIWEAFGKRYRNGIKNHESPVFLGISLMKTLAVTTPGIGNLRSPGSGRPLFRTTRGAAGWNRNQSLPEVSN